MGGGVCDLAGVCVRVFLFEILCGYEPERILCGNQRIWFLAMETGKCGGKRRGGRVGLQASDVALPERIGGSDGGFVRGGMFWVLSRFTDSPVPAGDAFTTALGVTATWMLAKRILEHWWVWVAVNLVSAVLYYYRGLYPTCFLFVCYGVLAVAGWINWKKKGVLYGG